MNYTAAVIQFEPELGKKEQNIQRLLAMAEEAACRGAKLIVMPEMATTGYGFTSREEIAPYVETIPGETVRIFGALAQKYRCYLVCGIPEVDFSTGIYYNSAFLIGPSGVVIGHYRKTHQFFLENRWAKDGDLGVPVFDTELGRISILICMDAMYFETARLAALKDADVIVFLTNWVGDRDSDINLAEKVWRSRAMENRVFFLAANRWGTEKGFSFTGHSMMINPAGEILCQGGKNDWIGYAEIDLEQSADKQVDFLGNVMIKRRPPLYQNLVLNTHLWYPGYSFKELPSGRTASVGVIQAPCPTGKIEANVAEMERLVSRAKQQDEEVELLLLPELITGFPNGEVAESVPGPTSDYLSALCRKFGLYLVYGTVEKSTSGLYNTAVVVGPEGYIGKYRKQHLNTFDETWAAAGDLGFTYFDLPFGRVGVLIGSEIFYPETVRALAKSGVDLICCPALWPDSLDNQLWHERTVANDVYIAVANQVGSYRGLSFKGQSAVLGRIVKEDYVVLNNKAGSIGSLTIDTGKNSFVRRKETIRKLQEHLYDPLITS